MGKVGATVPFFLNLSSLTLALRQEHEPWMNKQDKGLSPFFISSP